MQVYSNTVQLKLIRRRSCREHSPLIPCFRTPFGLGGRTVLMELLFLNDLNCQKQKRSDICRWTLPDTFFIEHQYVMAKPDLKVGLLTQIMSCIGINLHLVICIS